MFLRPVEVIAGATVSFIAGLLFQRSSSSSAAAGAAPVSDGRVADQCFALLDRVSQGSSSVPSAGALLAVVFGTALGWALHQLLALQGGAKRATALGGLSVQAVPAITSAEPASLANSSSSSYGAAPVEGDPALDTYVPRRR